jgi:hypothetical protein
MTLSIMTLSIMTLNIMTLSIMGLFTTFSISTLRITVLEDLSAIMLSVAFFNYSTGCRYAEFCNAECRYAECHYDQCRGTLKKAELSFSKGAGKTTYILSARFRFIANLS